MQNNSSISRIFEATNRRVTRRVAQIFSGSSRENSQPTSPVPKTKIKKGRPCFETRRNRTRKPHPTPSKKPNKKAPSHPPKGEGLEFDNDPCLLRLSDYKSANKSDGWVSDDDIDEQLSSLNSRDIRLGRLSISGGNPSIPPFTSTEGNSPSGHPNPAGSSVEATLHGVSARLTSLIHPPTSQSQAMDSNAAEQPPSNIETVQTDQQGYEPPNNSTQITRPVPEHIKDLIATAYLWLGDEVDQDSLDTMDNLVTVDAALTQCVNYKAEFRAATILVQKCDEKKFLDHCTQIRGELKRIHIALNGIHRSLRNIDTSDGAKSPVHTRPPFHTPEPSNHDTIPQVTTISNPTHPVHTTPGNTHVDTQSTGEQNDQGIFTHHEHRPKVQFSSTVLTQGSIPSIIPIVPVLSVAPPSAPNQYTGVSRMNTIMTTPSGMPILSRAPFSLGDARADHGMSHIENTMSRMDIQTSHAQAMPYGNIHTSYGHTGPHMGIHTSHTGHATTHMGIHTSHAGHATTHMDNHTGHAASHMGIHTAHGSGATPHVGNHTEHTTSHMGIHTAHAGETMPRVAQPTGHTMSPMGFHTSHEDHTSGHIGNATSQMDFHKSHHGHQTAYTSISQGQKSPHLGYDTQTTYGHMDGHRQTPLVTGMPGPQYAYSDPRLSMPPPSNIGASSHTYNPGQSTNAHQPIPKDIIKRRCFETSCRQLFREYAELEYTLTNLQAMPVKTDHDYNQQRVKFEAVTRRVREFTIDTGKVGTEGKELGDMKTVTLYDNKETIMSMHNVTERLLESSATERNIKPKVHNPLISALKSPSFDPNKKGDDFFTFKTKFDIYARAHNCSIEEQLLLLRNVVGPSPNTTIKDCKTAHCAWNCLRRAFGNPNITLTQRMSEIAKCGQCPEDPKMRKDWVFDITSKLQSLCKLATEHKIENRLYSSPVVAELIPLLPRNARNKFYEDCTDLGNMCQGYLEPEQEFRQLLTFLDWYSMQTITEANIAHLAPKTNFAKRNSPTNTRRFHATVSPARSASRSPSPSPPPPPITTKATPAPTQSAHAAVTTTSTAQKGQRNPIPAPRAKAVKDIKCGACKMTHTHLLYCKDFQASNPYQRAKLCKSLKVCYRCLRMDSELDFTNRAQWLADHKPDCLTKFACTEDSCAGQPIERQRHITVCGYHYKINKQKESTLIQSLDRTRLPTGIHFFFTAMHQTANVQPTPPVSTTTTATTTVTGPTPSAAAPPSATNQIAHTTKPLQSTVGNPPIVTVSLPPLEEDKKAPILMCQLVPGTRNRNLLIFYDTGCTGAAISVRASNILGCQVVRQGPTDLHTTGMNTTTSPYGDDRVELPMADKSIAAFNALKMEHVSHDFPLWSLSEAWNDLETEYKKVNKSGGIPKTSKETGGREVDIMIGMRYIKYFPKLIFQLPSGLAIYKSKFISTDGSRGVLAGPHESWMRAIKQGGHSGFSFFLTQEAKAYNMTSRTLRFAKTPYYAMEEDLMEAPRAPKCEFIHCPTHEQINKWSYGGDWDTMAHFNSILRDEKEYHALEEIGTQAEYRCITCRNCAKCRQGDILEKLSLREEKEQAQIENSVQLNVQQRTLEATLPFIDNPETKLTDNRRVAVSIFESQMRNIKKNPDMKGDILKAHDKLASKEFVVRAADLPSEITAQLDEIKGPGYYIPWRIMYKESSLSTPCRLVFDASSSTPGGDSLNNILAKGHNSLSRILDVLIRFRSRKHAFACDIKMAYNNLRLLPPYYKFHKYLWKQDLDESKAPEDWYLKTLIYGVKSAGQQTIAGFRILADHCIAQHPEHTEGAQALKDDAYMDDIIRSEDSADQCEKTANSITFTLALGSMTTKCYTYSGKHPHEDVSADGTNIGVLGYCWAPKDDRLSLDIKQLFFGKVRRGKLPETVTGDYEVALAKKFTRRTITAKVASVYDPLGLATPVTARFKLDLHQLVSMKLDWDDKIDPKFLNLWTAHLHTIQELRLISYPRAVIPANAVSPDISLIVSSDASEQIAIAAVHARFELQDGSYSCQLLTAKSKLVKSSSIPRSELKGAVVGAVLAHTVCRNVRDRIKQITFVTDSTIILYWITRDYRPLMTSVRNSIIEIQRLTSICEWNHVETKNNVADIGTRKVTTKDISEDSDWQRGRPWMSLPPSKFPLKTATEITLSNHDKVAALKETKTPEFAGMSFLTNPGTQGTKEKVQIRYEYSQYIVDPCKISWTWALRVVCWVYRVHDLSTKKRKKTDSPQYTEEELERARCYYFRLGTKEVKQYCKPSEYKNVTIEKDGMLFYKSRLLDDVRDISLEKNMRDVPSTKFVKPILDRYSPIAYAIMLDAHTATIHRGVMTTLQRSRETAFIINGKSLAAEIREKCPYCKRFKQRLLDVEMGKTHDNRLVIAAPFTLAMVDLAGPFNAYGTTNKRATVKVWALIIKCLTTCAISVKTLENYSAIAFTEAYTRHTAQYNHPMRLYIDAGTQLVKSCKQMKFSLTDWTESLNTKYNVGIDYQVCPVAAHHAHGVVERSIREVRRLFDTIYAGQKLSLLGYETAFSYISSELNNMPIVTGTGFKDLDHLDLITPSRLIHGCNITRAPVGPVTLAPPSIGVQKMEQIQKSWYKAWSEQVIQKYIPRSHQWTKTSYQPKKGDIVIFVKAENEIALGSKVWKIGRIVETVTSKDGLIRQITVQYKAAGEKTFRETTKTPRQLAVIHKESESELIEVLNEASRMANLVSIKRSL